ncbi:MAG TPA: lytic transglycosylase domain-containing protein [Gemmatimonadales bacterium]|nr:lytic transglycosylase domain-containing protein [Gemmatimonadales bacterium]
MRAPMVEPPAAEDSSVPSRAARSGTRGGARDPRGPSRGFVIALAVLCAAGAVLVLPIDWPTAPDGLRPASVADRAPPPPPAGDTSAADLDSAALDSAALDSASLERAAIARFAAVPLARVFRRHTPEVGTARRIARSVVAEARRMRVAPSLIAALVLIENPDLDPDTVSSRGATGLMQVMPFHAGEYGCPSDDLTDIEANICHGARVFAQYLRRSGTVRGALLRYNGCPPSAKQSPCARYPGIVLRTAGRVRHELLIYADAESLHAARAASR